MILCLRTDGPQAEAALVAREDIVQKTSWHAHRKLAATLHVKIKELLKEAEIDLHDLEGVIVYQGPGSFTGLRIGITVANALSDGLDIPVAGASGDDWIDQGLSKIKTAKSTKKVTPVYSRGAHITRPRK